jgi:hypothetical protein
LKIDAYKCDYCKTICEADNISGIINTPEIFQQNLFKVVEPHKAESHFCFECYRVNVEIHVKNRMKWKDGEKYNEERERLKQALTAEFSGIFKTECYRRFLTSKKKKA